MKTKHILVLLAVIAVALVGCSSITPAPQLIVTKVSPFWVSTDSADVTVIFKNINHVDAVVQHSRFTFRGTPSTNVSQSPIYTHNAYVPGDVDSTSFVVSVAGLSAIRTALGSPVTMWMKFWGADAYGFNKTFITDSIAVNIN